MLRLAVLAVCVAVAFSHGRLEDPPGRSTMWRFGFDTPTNVNDNELFCGGITRHWQQNKGNCGICGDAWDLPVPRPNEDGGTYGKGIVVKTYKSGQTITITTIIHANHLGYFEFRLCPVQPGIAPDQDCLDKFPLELADGSGTRFMLGRAKGKVPVDVKLPPGLRCDRCVLQWHWKCGNQWGICEDKKGRMGCGPQEYFRGCADIQIV